MDILRLALLVIGAILVVAILVLEWMKRRRRPVSNAIANISSADDAGDLHFSADKEPVECGDADLDELAGLVASSRDGEEVDAGAFAASLDDAGPAGDADAGEAPAMAPITDARLATPDMFEEYMPADEPDPEGASRPSGDGAPDDAARSAYDGQVQVIALNIAARPGDEFEGPDIVRALEGAGAVFGEMNIFHYYGAGHLASSRPVYSVANALEPGVFDIRRMAEFRTRGLVVFMQNPGPLDGRVMFELMLKGARQIAETLGGELRDENHEPADPQRIHALRERISAAGRQPVGV